MLVYFLAGVLGYLVIALLTARVSYGIERSRIITEEGHWHTGEDPLECFSAHGRSGTAVQAFVYGLAWPVVVPVYCLYRCAALIIMARPPRTPYERARSSEALDSRIRELEESLERYE